MGLPGCWAVLFARAVVEDPAGCAALLAHGGESAVAFRQSNALGTRNVIGFVAAWPTAHALACLRINAPVAGYAARLATGPGGLTPDRAGFAPAGRRTGFHEHRIVHSFLASRAWSQLEVLSPEPIKEHIKKLAESIKGHEKEIGQIANAIENLGGEPPAPPGN